MSSPTKSRSLLVLVIGLAIGAGVMAVIDAKCPPTPAPAGQPAPVPAKPIAEEKAEPAPAKAVEPAPAPVAAPVVPGKAEPELVK